MIKLETSRKKIRIFKREKKQHKTLTKMIKERINLIIMKKNLEKEFQMIAMNVQRRYEKKIKKMKEKVEAFKAIVAKLEHRLKASQANVLKIDFFEF